MNASPMRRPWTVGLSVLGVVTAASAVTVALTWPSNADGTGAMSDGDCRYQELDTNGQSSFARAVSPSGEYIVGEDGGRATIWRGDDAPETIADGFLADADNSEATAVNSAGVTVGSAFFHADERNAAWRFDDGVVSELKAPDDLDLPSDADVVASGINGDGDIVGYVWADGGEDFPDIPLKWEAGSDTAVVLETDRDVETQATGIADDGTVVGNEADADPNAGKGKNWQWSPDGDREDLPVPNRGWSLHSPQISGNWVLVNTGGDQYRWNIAEGGDPETLDMDEATAIDADGRVYGTDEDATPIVVDTDDRTELPVPDAIDDDTRYSPEAASADGRVIAGLRSVGEDEEEANTAMTWTCG